MPWWGWLVIGIFLMGAELFAVDAAFYLIFIGFSAVVTGLLALAVPSLGETGQWLFFAVMAVASMVVFREKLYRKLRGGAAGFGDASIGATVSVPDDVDPGATVRVDHRGTRWTARNVGEVRVGKGSQAFIHETKGSELLIAATPRATNPSRPE